MPKAKKLPSGSWACQVYVGDKKVNGKRKKIIETVTVNDPSERGRIRCESAALELKDRMARVRSRDITVIEALDEYICLRIKSGASAATISAYDSLARNAFPQLRDLPVRKLTDTLVQDWILDYQTKHAPKSVRNAYALLCSAVKVYMPGTTFNVNLPERKEPVYVTPTDDDIKTLLAYADSDPELKKAILLATDGTFRRGEICAFTYADIRGDTIRVSRDMIWDRKNHRWVIGNCKTPQSHRTVVLSPYVLKYLKCEEHLPVDPVVDLKPQQLTNRFRRLVKAAGLPNFRFHDLRAYSASVRHAIGIPDQYIMADGGWKSDVVLKRVYRRAMEDRRKEFSAAFSKHFDNIFDDEKPRVHTRKSGRRPKAEKTASA